MSEDRMFTVPSGAKIPLDEHNYIETWILIDLCEVVDRDLEGFLDYISEKACGSDMLMDINYRVSGAKEDMIILTVGGDVSMILDMEDEANG